MSENTFAPGPLKVGKERGHGMNGLYMVLTTADDPTITASYCTLGDAQLYAAAPDLAKTLDRLLTVIRLAGLNNLANGVQLGQMSWYVKASDAVEAADLALTKALGQPDLQGEEA